MPFVACHGASRAPIDWRLEALAYLHNLGSLYPVLRPRPPHVLEFAERAAVEAGEHDGFVPDALVEEGVALVDVGERRRLVRAYARDHRRAWKMICRHVGSTTTAERALVATAVRGAIAERRPPPSMFLKELDGDDVLERPISAIVNAVIPGLIWSIEDVEAAIGEVGRADPPASCSEDEAVARIDAIFASVASARARRWHTERLVEITRRLGRWGAAARCERFATRFAEVADLVESDHAAAAEALWNLLAKYAIGLSSDAPQPAFSPN